MFELPKLIKIFSLRVLMFELENDLYALQRNPEKTVELNSGVTYSAVREGYFQFGDRTYRFCFSETRDGKIPKVLITIAGDYTHTIDQMVDMFGIEHDPSEVTGRLCKLKVGQKTTFPIHDAINLEWGRAFVYDHTFRYWIGRDGKTLIIKRII